MNLTSLSDEQFVELLYAHLLGRSADPGGRQMMLEQLAAGAERLSMLGIILGSAEYAGIRAGNRFAPPGHFYSPIPDRQAVEAHRAYDWNPPMLPALDLREDAQLELVAKLAAFYPELPFADQPTASARYGYLNTAYAYGDGILLYSMLRHLEPRRIIEVGSGHSSCAILDAVDRFRRRDTEVTFIEPYPELLRSLLRPRDLDHRVLHARTLQSCPLSMFEVLEPGDVLFIDSSHVSKLGSDVNYLVFQILPALRPGVLVHIHDVFFPFEYPQGWLEEGRAWNEAYLLRAFLQYNPAWRIELFAHMLVVRQTAWFERHMPLVNKSWPAQLWIART